MYLNYTKEGLYGDVKENYETFFDEINNDSTLFQNGGNYDVEDEDDSVLINFTEEV